jgi:RNA-directed DNA polymerase
MKNISFGIENLSTSKRIGNLWDKAFSRENLYDAYLDARKGKQKKIKVFEFEKCLSSNLDELYVQLHNGSYEIGEYNSFFVYEPKKREIHAPQFRDLIVQHAIYRVIYNIFNPTFIDTSFACRKGGGTHKASEYTQKQMRKYSGDLYYAKLDIRKFFYSIDRDILKSLFEKKIKDKRFVEIMIRFANMGSDKGIPIGNLLSQIYSIIYMNELDQFIKRELKIKSYVRYVDDFMAIGLTLEEAKEFESRCEKFVQDKLNLELSHWTIEKIRKGINFVGYRTWRSIKFVRKHSIYKFKKAIMKKEVLSLISSVGHAVGTATLKYYKKLLDDLDMIKLLPKGTKQCLNI